MESAVSKTIPSYLLEEITKAITSKDYGSVEIYIESGKIVQITERTIRKTTTKFSSDIRFGSNKK